MFGKKVFSTKIKKSKSDINGFDFKAYANWVYELKTDKSKFVPITDKPYQKQQGDIKLFAYYLPQYHSIPENDDAHGKGFTEWNNVSSCIPQFVGHYQPHIPYDVGFYNLEDINVIRRQVELAKMYGLYGFCFYYYWFSGKKVLEKPVDNFLNSDIDFPFHLCWANENWSKLWDGGDKEVILEQNLQDGDAQKFFDDILPFIKDRRYEKINNKPLLMIYRPAMFDKSQIMRFLQELNKLAQQNGFLGFHFMASNSFGFDNPKDYGFEGIIEFPPHGIGDKMEIVDKTLFNQQSNISILNMDKFVDNKKYLYSKGYTIFKTCFPSWDNSARKTFSKGIVFIGNENCFERWLTGIIEWTKKNNAKDQQYAYINAWNEWAEGAHLEPDLRYGYRNLEIMKNCIEQSREKK